MITNDILLERYSTGVIHASPAAIEHSDGRISTYYECSASVDQILCDYTAHLLFPASSRCRVLRVHDDGVLRVDDLVLTEKELEWLWVEYKLRVAILASCASKKVEFVVREEGDQNDRSV